jgi:hypothetical protein
MGKVRNACLKTHGLFYRNDLSVLITDYTTVHFNLVQGIIKMLQWYMPGE